MLNRITNKAVHRTVPLNPLFLQVSSSHQLLPSFLVCVLRRENSESIQSRARVPPLPRTSPHTLHTHGSPLTTCENITAPHPQSPTVPPPPPETCVVANYRPVGSTATFHYFSVLFVVAEIRTEQRKRWSTSYEVVRGRETML